MANSQFSYLNTVCNKDLWFSLHEKCEDFRLISEHFQILPYSFVAIAVKINLIITWISRYCLAAFEVLGLKLDLLAAFKLNKDLTELDFVTKGIVDYDGILNGL
jgi:hypothetical protein